MTPLIFDDSFSYPGSWVPWLPHLSVSPLQKKLWGNQQHPLPYRMLPDVTWAYRHLRQVVGGAQLWFTGSQGYLSLFSMARICITISPLPLALSFVHLFIAWLNTDNRSKIVRVVTILCSAGQRNSLSSLVLKNTHHKHLLSKMTIAMFSTFLGRIATAQNHNSVPQNRTFDGY